MSFLKAKIEIDITSGKKYHSRHAWSSLRKTMNYGEHENHKMEGTCHQDNIHV